MGTITFLLQGVKNGEPGALDRLYAHVHDDLKLVAQRFARQRHHAAFQATELLGAAYERLAGKEALDAENRRQFFFLLSRAMHDVLVEQVRAEMAKKRGGKSNRVPMFEVTWEDSSNPVDILDLKDALAELRTQEPEIAGIVLLRFYGDMTLREVSEMSGVSYSTTRRQWDYAKAWLRERLTRGDSSGPRPS